MRVFDDRNCSLGEGPLWHPARGQFFWFDINAHRLLTRTEDGPQHWQFDDYVSAAGWVDPGRLMVATASALVLFDLGTGAQEKICDLEADSPATRCNDGRADPYGGFWIGTMGIDKQPDAGAIYRYYRGELRQLYAPWSIPNAICFTPDGGHAYLADTPRNRVWRQRLDAQGWPSGEPELFLDLPLDSYRPDGAVVDSAGDIWIAQYRHGKVVRFSPNGPERQVIPVPAARTTCPAFGGPELTTLYITTANQEMDAPGEADGRTYALEVDARGQAEHRVIL
nr:SMP-30/gluconolactonase/LRE family protein [Mesobacterium pallidum]